jgi:hypothetical protein
VDDRAILGKFSRSLITFEESRRHESLIRVFLSVANLYVRFTLLAQPIKKIIYLGKSPR